MRWRPQRILEPHVAEVVLAVPPGGAIGHARA
jgi:hypothetical protein